jgi:adenylate kinase
MKTVFVAGVPESGRNDILKLVLKNEKKRLPVFSVVDFDELVVKGLDLKKRVEIDLSAMLGNAKVVKAFQDRFGKALEKVMARKVRSGKNLVINGYFTVETPEGEIPLVPEDFFRTFKLNMIINMELVGGERDLTVCQDINRNHAASISSVSGAELKTILVERGNYRDAINDLTDSLEFVFG